MNLLPVFWFFINETTQNRMKCYQAVSMVMVLKIGKVADEYTFAFPGLRSLEPQLYSNWNKFILGFPRMLRTLIVLVEA